MSSIREKESKNRNSNDTDEKERFGYEMKNPGTK